MPSPPVIPDFAPLEQLVIPEPLSGRSGAYRALGGPTITAGDDRSAVLTWLDRYKDSPATQASYRKEVERLLLWCVLQHGRALSDLTHDDLVVYKQFLSDPQPPSRWVLAQAQKPTRSSSSWRPFAGPLSASSQRQAVSVINSLFNWLVAAGYLARNPLALSRRTTQHAAIGVQRFLAPEHWSEVKATIEAMSSDVPRDAAHAARCRWLFSLLYIGGLRVSEVCLTTMGGFWSRRSADGKERWWLEVTGKGRKTRLVPATPELMSELLRYRKARGLPPLPPVDDPTPLLATVIAPIRSMARSAVHELVKATMRTTAQRVRQRGPEHERTAAHIERASTHWMRHTAGTDQSAALDLKAVRDNLGHSNISTTSVYLHSEEDARHDATSAGHRVAWISS